MEQKYAGNDAAEYEELSPEIKKAIFDRTGKQIPFWNLLGIELVELKRGWSRLRLPFTGKLANAGGIAHGGAVFSAADSAVGTALVSIAAEDESISTIEMKINYIKVFGQGNIYAEAFIVHKGKNTALGEVEITDDKGNLIAKATATYAVIKRK